MNVKNGGTLKRMTEEYREIYNELFYIAYAVTGNDRAAEEALISVMLDPSSVSDPRGRVTERALSIRSSAAAEQNFLCFLDSPTDTPNALADWLSGESDETRRCVMLKYGCSLSVSDIATATDMPSALVRRALLNARKSAERFSRGAEKALIALCAREISKNSFAPDFNSLLRAAEAHGEAFGKNAARKPVKSAASWILAAVMLIALGIVIWMSAVMLDYYREKNKELTPQTVGHVIIAREVRDARV